MAGDAVAIEQRTVAARRAGRRWRSACRLRGDPGDRHGRRHDRDGEAFNHLRPAVRDARTQFYIAYACYREGWGRFYPDAALFRQGLDAAGRAIALTPQGTLMVDDPQLKMHTAAELKAELEQGLERSVGNLNPLRVLRERK